MEDVKQFLEKLKSGDRVVQQKFVQEYSPRIYRHLSKFIGVDPRVEDLVQLTLIKVLEKIKLFQGDSRPQFNAWVFMVAKNICLNSSRDEGNRWDELFEDSHTTDFNKLLDDHLGDRQIYEAAIHYIYNEMPSQQQKAIVYRLFEGMAFKEIAALMGIKYDTAKANYRHGLLKLRDHLETNYLRIPVCVETREPVSRQQSLL